MAFTCTYQNGSYNLHKYKVHKKALKALWNCKLNVDVLDGASIATCLLQRNFKTAGTIMFLLTVSGMLEDYTHARTKAVLTDSLAVKADKVWLVTDDNSEVLIPMSDLTEGDNIRVQTGNVIPVDGVVVSGEATVNESSMTGEPLPVAKREGITVFAGTVVEEGNIVVNVKALSSNTKISKIIDLIDNSENLKAGVQSRAETLADRIVPFSFLGFWLLWFLQGILPKLFLCLWLTIHVLSNFLLRLRLFPQSRRRPTTILPLKAVSILRHMLTQIPLYLIKQVH